MKSLVILIFMIIVFTSCGNGNSNIVNDRDDWRKDIPPEFSVWDESGNELEEIAFDQVLLISPTDRLEMDVMIKNDGQYPEKVNILAGGSNGDNFIVSTHDRRCKSDGELYPGESCLVTVSILSLPGDTGGEKTAYLVIMNEWGNTVSPVLRGETSAL